MFIFIMEVSHGQQGQNQYRQNLGLCHHILQETYLEIQSYEDHFKVISYMSMSKLLI
jgi:hypothetical protein